MKFIDTELDGVTIIEADVFGDERGFFLEFYHREKFADGGINFSFVQDNHSQSKKNVLRGLHFQLKRPQGKLIRVVQGEIFDVAVDIRKGSPTFGKWVGVKLSAENKRQFFIPPDFAHGFCVLSEVAEVTYKCTDFYFPEDEKGLSWNEPAFNIDWPLKDPVLSDKDKGYPVMEEVPLPVYRPRK